MQSRKERFGRAWETIGEILKLVPGIYLLASTVFTGLIWLFVNLSKIEVSGWLFQILQTLFWFLAALLLITMLFEITIRRSNILLNNVEGRVNDQLQSVYNNMQEMESRLSFLIEGLYSYVGHIKPKFEEEFDLDTATSLVESTKEDLLKADYSCSKALRRCIFIGTLIGKENDLRWMRQEVEGYKTLSELPKYRYCEVYDEAGILYDRKMPIPEPLSEIESYEHVLYMRSFEKGTVAVPSKEFRRIIDTVRQRALDFLNGITESELEGLLEKARTVGLEGTVVQTQTVGLEGVVEKASDGRPRLTIPVDSITAKEAVALLLFAVHPTPLSDEDLSALLSSSWKTIKPEAVRARASELRREGKLIAEKGYFSLSGAGVQYVKTDVISRLLKRLQS